MSDNKCKEIGVHTHPCSALVNGVCKNGFPVKSGCLPVHSRDPLGNEKLWYVANKIPLCLDENYVLHHSRFHQ